MAKFNEKNSTTTVNRDGYPAYAMNEKEHLVTAVLTTMFGEPKYYGGTDSDIVRLAVKCAHTDPLFLCKLTCYARNAANLRSVSHVLACVITREARRYTRPVIREIAVRPDDLTEIMACYLKMYGKPFPNALKKAVGEAVQCFDEYGLAKYSGRHRSMKFRDILRITHPVPKDSATAELFRKVLDGTLRTPETWEAALSARGNTAEVWNALVAAGNVGYMALLRNLRSIIKCGADLEPVLAILSDPERVRTSRQLPFRFYSAYLMLVREQLMTPQIEAALEKALTASVDNMETIPGRTLIAVDVSASMQQKISRKSRVRCREIAALLGAMANRMCEDGTVCYFDCEGWSCLPDGKGYLVRKYGADEPVLRICSESRFRGFGTQMELPMKYALEEGAAALRTAGADSVECAQSDLGPGCQLSEQVSVFRPFDRIIYFSDNMCNHSAGGLRKTVQGLVDEYREKFNKDFWVHGVDLQGYGTQQFCGRNFNLIAGWSESVLSFIMLAERGMGSLVKVVEEWKFEVDSKALG